MELTDKAAVMAEIERRKKIVEKRLYINNSYSEEGNAAWERDKALYDVYNSLLSFLDTLEVKEEVDLEKELDSQWKNCTPVDEGMGCEFANISIEQFTNIAKHFFELGLASQLTWQDIRLISELGEEFMNSEESDNCTDDEAYYSVILNKLKQLGRDYKTQRQEIRELNKAQKGE